MGPRAAGQGDEQRNGPADGQPDRSIGLLWVLDKLPALVALYDRDQRNVMANRAYLDWFALEPAALRGRHLRDVLGEDAYAVSRPHVEKVLAGTGQRFVNTVVTPAGEARHLQAAYVPHVLDGAVAGFFAQITDVTAQVEAERDLLEAQVLARLGSYTFVPGSDRVRFSPPLLMLMGLDPEGPGPTVEQYLELVHPDDRAVVDGIREQADRGEEYEADYRLLLADGTLRHVHSRTRRVLDAEGRVVMLRGVMQDETATQHLASELARANQLLTDLLGVLGHDLRQPIGVVNSYLEHLEEDWDHTSEEVRLRHVGTARRASSRLDLLVRDILTLVSVDTAAIAPRPEAVDLREVVVQAALDARLDLDLEVPEGLVACVDPLHARQIVANLVTNAGRYGRAPFVVSGRRSRDTVVLSVADHGEGVPQEFVPHLFDRFARASSGVASTTAGTGFGLYIVRALARANGGDVTHAHASPCGAVFTLTLRPA